MLKVVKSTAEVALCRSGLTRAARRRLGDATVVLAYHNVVPDGETVRGDRSLHLPRREFARQLDLIRRTHEVVPLESLGEHLSLPPDYEHLRERVEANLKPVYSPRQVPA